MSFSEDHPWRKPLRTMQVIAGALIAGASVFAVIATVIVLGRGQGQPADGDGWPVVTLAAFALLAFETPLSLLVPSMVSQSGVGQIAAGTWKPPEGADPAALATDEAKLIAVYQTAMIVGMAMLEGGAFLGCVAYLIEGKHYVLAVVAVALMMIVFRFPTEYRVRAWLERQTDQLAQLRRDAKMLGDR